MTSDAKNLKTKHKNKIRTRSRHKIKGMKNKRRPTARQPDNNKIHDIHEANEQKKEKEIE